MDDWLATLGGAMGTALLSGINLYAAVAKLGLLEHFGLAHLPGELGSLGAGVISLAAVLYLIDLRRQQSARHGGCRGGSGQAANNWGW